MSATVELWTDWECAGGVKVGPLRVVSGTFGDDLTGDDRCSIRVVTDTRAAPSLRDVLRITSGGVVREYRVQARSRPLDDGTRTITGVAPLADLATGGLVRAVTGGLTTYRFAGTRTPAAWLADVVLTNLSADGLGWVSAGTVESATPIVLESPDAGWSRLEWLRRIAAATGAELVLRRDGATGYRVDLLTQRGAGAAAVRVRRGRNVISLADSDDDGELATAITVQGATVDGVVAGIGENAWTVGTIPGAAPYWVPLSDPDGGAPPITWDDQLNGAWLLLKDGTTLEVTDSRASDSAVLVSATTGLVAGDLVQVVADANATRLQELTNPTQPRLHRVDRVPALRGERNLQRNGTLADWPTLTTCRGFTTNAPGSSLVRWARYPRNAPVNVTANGAPALFNGTNWEGIAVTGAPPWFVFYDSEYVRIGASSDFRVLQTVQCDESGACLLPIDPSSPPTGTLTLSPIYNTRVQSLPDDGTAPDAPVAHTISNYTFLTWPPTAGQRGNAALSEPITVRRIPALPQLVVVAGFTVRCVGADASQWPRNFVSGTPTNDPAVVNQFGLPAVDVLVGGTSVARALATGNPTAAGTYNYTPNTSLLLTADTTAVQLALYGSGVNYSLGRTLLRYVMLYLAPGPPSALAPIIGDAPLGNQLWHRANRALQARALSVRQIRCTLRDLSAAAGYSITREQLTLGGPIALDDLGITVRAVALQFDVTDPGNVVVTLDSRPTRLVEFLAERIA